MPSKTSIEHFDVHAAVTRKIITAIEEGAGAFKLPWIESSGRTLTRPINVASSAPYNGVNVLVLWIEALAQGFTSGVWGTYRQWQARGAQVRKGESSSLIVFYKMTGERDEDHEEDPGRRRMFARASRVFNACQVEGFEPLDELPASETTFEPLARAEVLLRGVGANIREGADMACYLPTQDIILMPSRERFVGSSTCSPTESFYATLCHELVHWSGASRRLNRDLGGRFGSHAYAMEELVAELGAAFLCADLGVCSEPRRDHAAYIQSWLTVLKSDKRAIFTAASKASQASIWLQELAQAEP